MAHVFAQSDVGNTMLKPMPNVLIRVNNHLQLDFRAAFIVEVICYIGNSNS